MSHLEQALDNAQQQQVPMPFVQTPSMGELLQEADTMYSRVSASNDLVSKIENVTEHLENINAEIVQEGALSDLSRKMISKTHRLLTGVDVMMDRMVALESADADPGFKDDVVQEIQNNTLNEFLAALKEKFYDSWGDTKSWYGKIVSIRSTIVKKNADTIERAAKVTGDPKTLEFTFKENLDIDSNGRVSFQELLSGVEAMLGYTEKRLNAKVDKNFEDFIVGCQRVVDGYKSKGEADYTELLKYKDLYSPPPEVLTSELEDKTIKAQLTDSDSAKLIQTRRFPGATYVVISAPGTEQKATPVSFIEDTWVKLYTEKSAEEKDSIKVRTFYPNQIVHLATELSKGLDSLSYFDKSWERRDKFMTKVFASLDKTITLVGEKLTDSSKDTKTDEELRAITRIMIKAIQLDNTFNSMLINHVIKITAQCVDLNNACLLQYSSE